MDIVLRDTICAHHPENPHSSDESLSQLHNALLDGTLGRITVITDDSRPPHEPFAPWSAVMERAVPEDGENHLSALAAVLRRGGGSILVLDCGCEIRAAFLSAFANLSTPTALVAEPGHFSCPLYARTHRKDRRTLALDGLGGEGDLGYLGTLFLTEHARAVLCAVLDEGGNELSWPETVSRLAHRSPVHCATLAKDVHGNEVVVGGALAGGSHARTYVRLHPASGRRTVRKEAVGAGRDKLTEEIGWLRGLERAAGRHFPKVVESRIEPDGVSVDLAYHHLPTLRRLILGGEVDEEEAARWARRALATMRRDLYPVGHAPVPRDYVRRTHLDRIARRLVETARALPDRRRLWAADEVRVNGVPLHGAQRLVRALTDDPAALRLLTPRRLARTHGDPHFDNILIDRRNHRFFLIDPRGNAGYDVSYDLGKIWHSVNSFYDLIHDGHVGVEAGEDEINYTFTSPHLVNFYGRVRERLCAWLTATGWDEGDDHWLLKVRMAEAAHMCSVMPFHIARDQHETVALACYARGLELINSLYEDLTTATATAAAVTPTTTVTPTATATAATAVAPVSASPRLTAHG
ncbi:hypothetical protein M2271_000882 [Streptomyces sp. LBL]|uniref:phosphotransferase n=1 Tax=Streptomyces sp. LBL TaxID=2940562 RepID=UPI002474D712|nr:phosphotransferase [Streptomyces sp. LBL]MDH6623095.1 hypothetical protein [Streptomyces sp. LBL]